MRKEVAVLVTEVFAPSRATSVVEAQEALVFQVRAARLPVEVMQLHPAQQEVLAAALPAAATLHRLALLEVPAQQEILVQQEVPAAALLAAKPLLLVHQEAATLDYAHQVVQRQVLHLPLQ